MTLSSSSLHTYNVHVQVEAINRCTFFVPKLLINNVHIHTGMMLAAIGERITSSISRIQKHNLCIENPRIGAAIQCLVLFGGGLVIFITLPAIIFWKIEGWTYWEAWYYCFITLSTIGFGDFVVG